MCVCVCVSIYKGWVQVTSSVTLSNIILSNIFKLDVNFDKSTTGLHYFRIFSKLTKFKDDQKSIAISSIICLNSSFYSLK